jgi:hypothetical protein
VCVCVFKVHCCIVSIVVRPTMSTEFLRLYHQLTRIDPQDPNPDVRYMKERKEVLRTLGYAVQATAGEEREMQRVEPNKYHGKMARRTQWEKKKKAIVTDHAAEGRRRLALTAVIKEADKLNGAVSELTRLLADKQPIPRQLWEELAPSTGASSSSSPSRHASTGALSSSSAKVGGHNKLPPLDKQANKSSSTRSAGASNRVYVETLPRTANKITKSFTLNLWTKAERDRLNQLYCEIKPPPTNKNLDMWRVYYETVGTRFKTFFPSRDLEEVIIKLEEMILLRQMKIDDEIVYWEQCKHAREIDHSDTDKKMPFK